MAVEIVRLLASNIEVLNAVAEDVFDGDIVLAQALAYAAAPGHLMLLAIDCDIVVGQIAAVIHHRIDQPSELYIDNLGVTPSRQRQGIARKLLDGVAGLGRSMGCAEAWVVTNTGNFAARALYAERAEVETVVMYGFEA